MTRVINDFMPHDQMHTHEKTITGPAKATHQQLCVLSSKARHQTQLVRFLEGRLSGAGLQARSPEAAGDPSAGACMSGARLRPTPQQVPGTVCQPELRLWQLQKWCLKSLQQDSELTAIVATDYSIGCMYDGQHESMWREIRCTVHLQICIWQATCRLVTSPYHKRH